MAVVENATVVDNVAADRAVIKERIRMRESTVDAAWIRVRDRVRAKVKVRVWVRVRGRVRDRDRVRVRRLQRGFEWMRALSMGPT